MSDRPSSGAVLRIGIAGAGLMGRWHAYAARRVGAKLVAVADPDPSAARLLGSRGGVAVFDDSISLARSGAVDVLHVCSPPGTHAVIVRAALESGLHVLVEKPLTSDSAQTDGLLDLASERGLLLCPVHQFPFQRGFLQLQRRLDTLGDIRSVDANFQSAGAEGFNGAERDRVVADILPHPLSMMYRLNSSLPDPESWSTTRAAPGEFSCTTVSNGCTYRIRISMGSRPSRTWLHVSGTEGGAHVDLFHGYAFFEPAATGRTRKVVLPFEYASRQAGVSAVNLVRRTITREPAYPGLTELVRRFYRAVRTGEDVPVPDDETSWVARARDALTFGLETDASSHE